MGKRIEALQNENAQKKLYNADANRLQNNYEERQTQIGRSNNPNNLSSASRDNYITYPYDFFAGTDAKIFFGDIWVDDIITIQYQYVQNKEPIYSYASQYFDAVAKGTIIVQGSLTIAFKEIAYLTTIAGILEAQQKNYGKAWDYKKAEIKKQFGDNKATLKYSPNIDKLSQIGLSYSPTGNPSIIKKNETIEEILQYKKYGNIISSGYYRQLFGSNKNTSDFEDFAEMMEDTIWGDANGNPYSQKGILKNATEFDYNSNGGITVGKNIIDGQENYANVLNILLSFGNLEDNRAEHTLCMLNDVHFTGQGQVVSITGEPIGETYQFFARDINKSVSSKIFSIPDYKFNFGVDNKDISTPEAVEALEQFLSDKTTHLTVHVLSSYDPNKQTWSSSNAQNKFVIRDFRINKAQPFLDQLISSVENVFNNLNYSEYPVNTDYTQYFIKVSSDYMGEQDIHMVLDQKLPGTKTYRVISPTRHNYTAVDILSREELFKFAGEPTPLPVSKEQAAKNAQKMEANKQDTQPKLPDNKSQEEQTKTVEEQSEVTSKIDTNSPPDISMDALMGSLKAENAKFAVADKTAVSLPVIEQSPSGGAAIIVEHSSKPGDLGQIKIYDASGKLVGQLPAQTEANDPERGRLAEQHLKGLVAPDVKRESVKVGLFNPDTGQSTAISSRANEAQFNQKVITDVAVHIAKSEDCIYSEGCAVIPREHIETYNKYIQQAFPIGSVVDVYITEANKQSSFTTIPSNRPPTNDEIHKLLYGF